MLPGDDDTAVYQRWAHQIAEVGIAATYEETFVDYPPVALYVFYPIGKVYQQFVPSNRLRRLQRSAVFRLLVKTPHIVFDLAVGGLLYWLVAMGGTWSRTRSGAESGRLAAFAYLWNPAVLWGSAYWGQLDAVHIAFAIAALTALGFQWVGLSGALVVVAGLMKPLAAPMVPVMAVAIAARHRLNGLARATLGGVATAFVILLPFIVTGRLVGTTTRLLSDLNAMAFTSINGHNFWMITGSWKPSNEPLVGPFDAITIGMTLFAAVATPLLVRSWSWLGATFANPSDYAARLFVLAAAINSCFFFFAPNMHEHHLMLTIPLLLAVAGRDRRLAWLALGASVAVLLNMGLHDMDLPYSLPYPLSERSPLVDPYLVYDLRYNPVRHAYGQDVHFTWLQVVGIWLNTLLVVAVAIGTYGLAWRRVPGETAVAQAASTTPR